MEEAGLFFCSLRTPEAELFRLVTKQEFDSVGIIIPGSALAPSQAAVFSLITGETAIAPLKELLASAEVAAVGHRRLARPGDHRLSQQREANLRLAFQRLAEGQPGRESDAAQPRADATNAQPLAAQPGRDAGPPDQARPADDRIAMMLGEKTPTTARLRRFAEDLDFQPQQGRVSLRVVEEIEDALRGGNGGFSGNEDNGGSGGNSGSSGEAQPGRMVAAALFKGWFCGGEIADLMTSLSAGRSSDFSQLTFAAPEGPKVAHDGAALLKQAQDFIGRAGADDRTIARLAAARRAEQPSIPKAVTRISAWVSGVFGALASPEVPIIDLSALAAFAEGPAKAVTRSCVVTTRPTAKLCVTNDVVIDRAGAGLNLLTRQELERLDLELSQSKSEDDQRLRTLVAQKLAT